MNENNSRYKPLYKNLIKLRVNVQNRIKIKNFKKLKWKKVYFFKFFFLILIIIYIICQNIIDLIKICLNNIYWLINNSVFFMENY